MPGLKDLLKKKDKIERDAQPAQQASLNVPEFTIMRTTTETEEVIEPPDFQDETIPLSEKKKSKERRHTLGFRKSANAAITKDPTAATQPASGEKSSQQLPVRSKAERRISERLHLHTRSRSTSAHSDASGANLPQDLPDAPTPIVPSSSEGGDPGTERDVKEQREAQWEKRATILAQSTPLLESEDPFQQPETSGARSRSPSISNKRGDENIQEAIRLHEIGELKLSTDMFGRLGDPKGQNNALAQILYGLALRHGWGVPAAPEKAVHYLSLAASNSASIEQAALDSGMNKGGAAKGELVLAIFELANCFRHGYGVKKDAVAARQYYETAANLGDTDAMEAASWCYLEGYGTKKDKVRSTL